MLKALAGSPWGQKRETLLQTYNALGKFITGCAARAWSTNASDSSFKKIQTAQNAALRTATGAHKMASIDQIHVLLINNDIVDNFQSDYTINQVTAVKLLC